MGPGMDEEMMEYGGEEETRDERKVRHHQLLDLSRVEEVEFKVADDGRVWVNVNGVCVLRIHKPQHIIADISKGFAEPKVIVELDYE